MHVRVQGLRGALLQHTETAPVFIDTSPRTLLDSGLAQAGPAGRMVGGPTCFACHTESKSSADALMSNETLPSFVSVQSDEPRLKDDSPHSNGQRVPQEAPADTCKEASSAYGTPCATSAPSAAPSAVEDAAPSFSQQCAAPAANGCRQQGDDRMPRSLANSVPDTHQSGRCRKSNFRDLATIGSPRIMREGRVYRCSQFHTSELRDRLGIKSIMDLRKSDKECAKLSRKAKELMHPEWTFKRFRNLPSTNAPRCPNCEAHLNSDATSDGVQVCANPLECARTVVYVGLHSGRTSTRQASLSHLHCFFTPGVLQLRSPAP